MAMEKDFNVHNMPAMLARTVTRPDERDPSKWVRDEAWYESVREMYFHLFMFFQDHSLLTKRVVESRKDVDLVVLRFSDFTVEGKAFVMSKAPHKWLGSFDRPGSKKKLSDVSSLEKHLSKLRASG